MDVFMEQIVVKKNSTADLLKIAGIIVGGLLVIAFFIFLFPGLVPFLGSFGIIFAAGAAYGAWYLLTGMNVEYEYILTNGEIDIDKIIARRKRKRLITVNCRNFTEFGPYRAAEHAGRQYDSTILACTSPDDADTYYAVTEHPKFGNCLVVFNPNETIIENAKTFIKRNAVKS